MKPTRIYLVRHGTTEWNKEEIFRGRAECHLNETGHAEARALADSLGDQVVDRIYCSPLARARETAGALSAKKGILAVPDEAFTDMDFGEWQGLTLQTVKERYPALFRTWRETPQDVAFPGGESLRGVRERAWEGLERVVRENPGKTILIVTHRVITKVLICALLGLGNEHFWQIRQGTTAVNGFEHNGSAYLVDVINDTCHLKSLAGGLEKSGG